MTLLKQHLFRCVRLLLLSEMLSLSINRYQGHIGAALVLGGVDVTGPQLFTIHPHGSTDKLPYVTMGSGSLAAMAVFESNWKPDMTVIGLFLSLEHQRADVTPTARTSPSASDSRHLGWYLQRSRFGFECRRMRHHCDGHRDATQLCQTKRAR